MNVRRSTVTACGIGPVFVVLLGPACGAPKADSAKDTNGYPVMAPQDPSGRKPRAHWGYGVLNADEIPTQDAIRAVIEKNPQMFDTCFDDAKARNDAAHGLVIVRIRTVDNGTVSTAELAQNTVGDVVLGQCTLAAVKGLAFAEAGSAELHLILTRR